MKALRKSTLIYALTAVIATGFTACSDDDDALRPLDQPVISATGQTFNSLSFNWNRIDNAVQYGWQLVNPAGDVVATGVTQKPEATITGLAPATTYTLNVWAYAAFNSGFDSAPQVTLTATTDPLTKLATPAPQMSEEGVSFVFSWVPVADAEAYAYKVTGDNYMFVDTVTDTSVSLRNLAVGTFDFSVSAVTTEEGFENGDYSQPLSFNYTHEPIWKVEGKYYSYQLDQTWDATMLAYADGSYSILSWYGVEGYDFSFSIDPDDDYGSFQMQCGTFNSSTWLYAVKTGLPSLPTINIYPWYEYSFMTGNQNAGKVNINNEYDWNGSTTYVNDTFTWGSSEGIDAVLGTYSNILTGYEWDDYISVH